MPPHGQGLGQTLNFAKCQLEWTYGLRLGEAKPTIRVHSSPRSSATAGSLVALAGPPGPERITMSKKLYVGNLPVSTTADDLLEAFGNFGTVTQAQVVSDRALAGLRLRGNGARGRGGHCQPERRPVPGPNADRQRGQALGGAAALLQRQRPSGRQLRPALVSNRRGNVNNPEPRHPTAAARSLSHASSQAACRGTWRRSSAPPLAGPAWMHPGVVATRPPRLPGTRHRLGPRRRWRRPERGVCARLAGPFPRPFRPGRRRLG